MVFTTHNGLSVIDLNTRKIRPIVEGRVSDVVVGRKTPQVFYFKGDTVYATNLDSGETRPIVTKPELRSGSGLAVNADETLLGGSFVEGPPPQPATPTTPPGTSPQERGDNYPGKGAMMERRLAARIPMALYTINIKTGEVKTFNHSTDWQNHVQFSPTDPNLIMFCHEGPWHKVDRIWTIHTDGTGLKKIHTRTMDMEIAGLSLSGMTCRLPKEGNSGWPALCLLLARRSVTKCNATSGRFTITPLPMENFLPVMAAAPTAWQLPEMVNGFIFSHQKMAS